ncbi:arginine repressor [Enterococcus timonensis]|uniref:arginine repressor n=1 Tax=Enterococcus timonensis TaxID=1852364 RepID=UPI0008D96AF5|nr:hypothetical protein [Enterococcus timonensis]
MKKKERQKLLQILMETTPIRRQEDFVAALKEQGIPVTQATISRDIKEMQLIKVPAENYGSVYALPQQTRSTEILPRVKKILKTSLIKMDRQNNLLALRLQPGSAVAAGSLLEKVFADELFTIMTDDSHVLLFAENPASAEKMDQQINEWIDRL